MSALSRWRGARAPQADLVRRFASDRSALLGLAIIAIIAIVGVAAPWLSPFDPNAQALQLRRAEPSREHVLGMDELGRDILSRLMYGAGNTLVAGTIAVLVGAAVGVPLGLIAGYYGRYVDAMLAFPAFLLAIVIVAVLGPSLENATLAIGIAQIPAFTRLVRGSVLSVREREFVMGAVAVGARGRDIMARHILPNVMPSIIVLSTVSLANAVLSIAGLSFLGLGAQPPAAEWGVMLRSGREYIRDAPHLTVVPGVAIVALVLSFNLIGDGLRDALDPRLARR
jgi:ABC-type dipeptide/oligopeptide/nickel transport system permease subunit